MKCKNCGANLEINAEFNQAKCPFCKASFKINDKIQQIQYSDAEQTGYEFEKGRLRAQRESIMQKNHSNNTTQNELDKTIKLNNLSSIENMEDPEDWDTLDDIIDDYYLNKEDGNEEIAEHVSTIAKKKTKNIALIILEILFFPFTLTYFIIKSKKLTITKKIIVLVLMWLLFAYIAECGNTDTAENKTTTNNIIENSITENLENKQIN